MNIKIFPLSITENTRKLISLEAALSFRVLTYACLFSSS